MDIEAGVYMECIRGGSNKFYSIKVVKNTVHLRNGRCGAVGVSNEKAFGNAAAAQAFALHQAHVKLAPAKGYQLKKAAPAGFWGGDAGGIAEGKADGRDPIVVKAVKGKAVPATKTKATRAKQATASSSSSSSSSSSRSSAAAAAAAAVVSDSGKAARKQAGVKAVPVAAPAAKSSPQDGIAMYWKNAILHEWSSATIPAGDSTTLQQRYGAYSTLGSSRDVHCGSRQEAMERLRQQHVALNKLGFTACIAPAGFFSGTTLGGGELEYRMDHASGTITITAKVVSFMPRVSQSGPVLSFRDDGPLGAATNSENDHDDGDGEEDVVVAAADEDDDEEEDEQEEEEDDAPARGKRRRGGGTHPIAAKRATPARRRR